MDDQKAVFQDRLAWINDPRNVGYQDAETGIHIPKRLSKAVILKKASKNVTFIGLVAAVLVGALCLLLAPALRLRVMPLPGDGTMIDLTLAMVLAILMGSLVGQKTVRHVMAQACGVAIMVASMHNLIWEFPTPSATIYSAEYVDLIMAHTAPKSIQINGVRVAL